VLSLHEALSTLEARDARQGRVVELRYFGGLDINETAEVLGVSPATVKRDWRVAKLWLRRELLRGGSP
jgi:RNA polymerase sigma-70 factor (ECF subfamily)